MCLRLFHTCDDRDGCRVLPKNVFWADTIIVSCGLRKFERTSWWTQHCPKFWDCAMNWRQRQTTASSSLTSRTTTLECATVAQYGWSNAGRSTIPITISIHLGQKCHDHALRKRVPSLCCERQVVVKYVDTLWPTLILRFTDTCVRTRFLERHMRWKVFGMQQAVYQKSSRHTAIASELSVRESLPRPAQ